MQPYGRIEWKVMSGSTHSAANVVELVGRSDPVIPTAEEASDRSKGDALSKAVVIPQTLWLAIRCIARYHEGL